MVKIQKLQKDGESDRFLVSDCTRETINAIRRVTMNAVPSMAVETISIYENNSHLFDEYIAHRIGLVPLTTDYKNYKIGEKCELSVEKEGPCTVYSGDFKSEDNKIKPVSDKIPIVKLNKDQKVKIEMNAVMDVGSKNVKYCPAIIGYKEVPDIKDFGDGKNGEKIIKSCPVNVLELKKGKVCLTKAEDCIACGECRDKFPKDIKLTFSENDFVLSIESINGSEAEELLGKAIEILMEKNDAFAKELKKL